MAVSGGSAQPRPERLNSAGVPKLEPTGGLHGRLWQERPNSAGAPKLGGSTQTRWWERPNSAVSGGSPGAPKLFISDDLSMRDPHCEVMLSGRTSHARVEIISFFVLDWICQVGMVI